MMSPSLERCLCFTQLLGTILLGVTTCRQFPFNGTPWQPQAYTISKVFNYFCDCITVERKMLKFSNYVLGWQELTGMTRKKAEELAKSMALSQHCNWQLMSCGWLWWSLRDHQGHRIATSAQHKQRVSVYQNGAYLWRIKYGIRVPVTVAVLFWGLMFLCGHPTSARTNLLLPPVP